MPQMNMVQAINDGLRLEMRRDPRVVVLGEDVGKVGGVFRVTAGLFDEFGDDRVIDTPLSEGGIIGTAIGMALYGLLPVPEIQFADFIFPAYDQIVSELAKYRYRSGGEYPAKLVIRTPVGGGIRGGHYHSQSPEAQFIHVAGLKVVCPSNPVDAKGLFEEFGPDRSIDTPLSEGGIIGTAIGMALYGLRPVAEIQFSDFIFPAFDQIVSELAKYRYRSGGQYSAPMVIRTPVGGGIRGGHYHSQSPEAQFIHVAASRWSAPRTRWTRRGSCSPPSAIRTRCSSSSRSGSTAPRRATCRRATTRSSSARRRSCVRAST